ncbi:SMODS domain-containing nucleotidyltransferase [Desulfotomaculum nigrificans]|uniref:SMODS domain-containing nucleotidyltransferase n=1 Tax=Desulfotomaculum nigrificans TaxID=1565 RepID=UPI0031F37384
MCKFTVKESIKKTYPNTHNVGDGQVVVVSFTDGIKFEVIPVFLNREETYTYPDANNGGGWKVTDPVAEINAINDANNTYNQKVKHLAKMARAWKEKCNVPVPGILIDTLVFNFMKKWEYNDKSFLYYDFMTRDFLKYLSEQNPSQGYWLAPGSNRRVYGKGKFESKAKSSYNDALRAIEYENAKKEYSANQEWRKIFGNYFPS